MHNIELLEGDIFAIFFEISCTFVRTFVSALLSLIVILC